MKITKKYGHIGYSYPGVGKGWVPIVERAIVKIERAMWVQWLPLFIKRWIHYFATGNSVVRIENRFWFGIREKLTGGQMVTDIKDKYATLRIYGCFGDEINKIVERAEKECLETCEACGGKEEVETINNHGWYTNLCGKCINEIEPKKKVIKEDKDFQ